MRVSLWSVIGSFVLIGLLSGASLGQTTEPAVFRPDDPALSEHVGMTVLIDGTVSSAEWSQTGRVMEIRFSGVTDAKGFTAVVFERNRQVLDEAFGGDLAKSLSGASVRIKGKLRTYGGRSKALEGRIEMTIEKPEQITITAPPGSPSEGN